MALYENGKRISGIRDFPAYTWAEYQALPVAKRPKVWKCTDRDYTEIPRESVSVTADGSKTYAQVLGSLRTAADLSKITPGAILEEISATYKKYFKLTVTQGNQAVFERTTLSTSVIYQEVLTVDTTGAYIRSEGNTIIDRSSAIPTSGSKFTLYY